MTRLLFVGESWQGSSARSLREALALQPDVVIRDIGHDHYLPNYRTKVLRLTNRVLRRLQVRELAGVIVDATKAFRPDAILVYKGAGIDAALLAAVRALGIPSVNVFPDNSPHAHGRQLRTAIGSYDLVVSTKPFHPSLWRSSYGYTNRCVCVPHGYDPSVHLWPAPAPDHSYDVAFCGTWRLEYDHLMRSFAAALAGGELSVAVGGAGWQERSSGYPRHWKFFGRQEGRTYGEFLRSGKIAIAPVNRDMVVNGVRQHGDVDTTRTYELAAAYCFFLHQRTDYVSTIFDEHSEVPLWSDAEELAGLVRIWLPDDAGRIAMAARAHTRAVPAYSIATRAASVLDHIREVVKSRNVIQ